MANSSRAGLVAAAITADDEQAWPPSSPKRRAARSQRFRGWGEIANGDVQKHCDCPIGRTQTTNGCVSKRSNSTTSPLFTSTQPFPSIISTASEALPFSMASNQLVKSLMSGQAGSAFRIVRRAAQLTVSMLTESATPARYFRGDMIRK
jgi:hypothetical protein